MNDSGIFDDGQLSRESSVVRSEDTKPETIPPFPGQKRRTTGRANNKKRRRYEIVHMDHSYSYVPDPQFEYLYGALVTLVTRDSTKLLPTLPLVKTLNLRLRPRSLLLDWEE